MKQTMKRAFCLILLFSLLFNAIPIVNVYASSNTNSDALIQIQNVSSQSGATVELDISVINNPGIYSIEFKVAFDDTYLTLSEVRYNTEFGGSGMAPPLNNNFIVSWFNSTEVKDITKDGVLLTLTFNVDVDAPEGTFLPVSVVSGSKECFNADDIEIPFAFSNGGVNVLTPIPGDINGDRKVTTRDVTRLHQYVVGSPVEVDTKAIDTNGDGKVTTRDVTRLHQYVVGCPVDLYYDGILHVRCQHTSLTAVPAKDANCTEDGNHAYWDCDNCDKLFSDAEGKKEITLAETVIAKGHTEENIPDVEPTDTEWGSSGGVRCSVCKKTLVEPTPIPPLGSNDVVIEYDFASSIPEDAYLPNAVDEAFNNGKIIKQYVCNVTDSAYTDLQKVENRTIVGYNFEGWYDSASSSDGKKVTEIPKGTKGNITLYARWTKPEYDITYHADLKGVPSNIKTKRCINEVVYLPNDEDMYVDHYVFVGWSDSSGRIIERIEPGTENIIVHANWTSNRSQAVANDYKNQGPIIIEEQDAQKINFVYYLGYLKNVPLDLLKFHGYVSSFDTEKTIEEEVSFVKEQATTVNETIENMTTKSSSWTLSNDWNELVTEVDGKTKEVSDSQTLALSTGESKAYNSSGSDYVGKSFHASKDDFVTSKTITDDSWKNSAELDVNAGWGPVKAELNLSGEQAHSEHQEDYSEEKTNMTLDSSWNSTTSYSNSSSIDTRTNLTNTVMQKAQETWRHEISKAIGGSDSETEKNSVSNKQTEGYSSTMKFAEINKEKHTYTIKTNSSVTPGWYRHVLAGNFYVYAIVTYDIKTGTYSVTNQAVQKDGTYTYLDYSRNDSEFKDYNNAVLPFEVPIDVHNYVYNSLAITQGLEIDRETGIITGYDVKAGEEAKIVSIPDYAVLSNGPNELPDVVKVVGFEEDVFAGKNIEKVRLSKFITEIPDNAFKNCASLKGIEFNELTKIGSNAFDGCGSLENFTVPNTVKDLGINAFNGVKSVITINASEKDVTINGVTSTCASLVLDLEAMTETLGNTEFDVKATDSFTINGYGREYENLSIKANLTSDLNINRMVLVNNKKASVDITAPNLILNQVKVEGTSRMALISRSENMTIHLHGKSSFASVNDKGVILAKNLTIVKKNGISETSELDVKNNKVYITGTINDQKDLLKNETLKSITSTQFSDMLDEMEKTCIVTFNPNGGKFEYDPAATGWEYVTAYGEAFGNPPKVVREGFEFIGWFDENGNQINAETEVYEDFTVKARWLSDYVEVDDVPQDAEITEDTKWEYDLTETKESTQDYLEGYTLYDTTWEWGEYGEWSAWQKAAISESEEIKVETRRMYSYYYYLCKNCGYHHPWQQYCKCGHYVNDWNEAYFPIPHTNAASHIINGSTWYERSDGNGPEYDEYRSCTREKIYTYHHKKTSRIQSPGEIPTYPENYSVSNVQKLVRYIVK